MDEPTTAGRARSSSVDGRRGSLYRNLLVLAVTTLAVLAGVWATSIWRSDHAPAQAGELGGSASAVDVPESGGPAPEIGAQAPHFSASTLDGGTFDLADTGNRPVWLIFNATWCANCRAEIPDVEEMYERFGDEIAIVSVFLSDTPSAVLNYRSALQLTHAQVVDPSSEIGALYRVMGVPSHYFISVDGTLQDIEVGVLGLAAMEEHLAALLP